MCAPHPPGAHCRFTGEKLLEVLKEPELWGLKRGVWYALDPSEAQLELVPQAHTLVGRLGVSAAVLADALDDAGLTVRAKTASSKDGRITVATKRGSYGSVSVGNVTCLTHCVLLARLSSASWAPPSH